MQLVKANATRLLKLMTIMLLAGITFVSCNKDNDDVKQPATAEGLYSGKYGFGTDVPDNAYKLNFKSGGVLQEIGISSGAVTGQGTWQVNGNTITGTYTMVFSPFNVYSISGTFDAATQKITGTWGYDNSATDGGKMEIVRQ
jgi:hypothetical protein